jgi:hypothetical protein
VEGVSGIADGQIELPLLEQSEKVGRGIATPEVAGSEVNRERQAAQFVDELCPLLPQGLAGRLTQLCLELSERVASLKRIEMDLRPAGAVAEILPATRHNDRATR